MVFTSSKEYGIWSSFVETTLELSAIVPVDNLCGPIVTSQDNDHLWILSMI